MADVFDIVYAAGLLDGEGSIVIVELSPGKRRVTPSFALVVTVANNSKVIHDWLVSTFGGSVSPSNRWCRTYQWKLVSNQAMDFLSEVAPYLKIKKEQAELAVCFQRSKNDYTTRHLAKSNYNGGNVIPPNEVSRRRKLKQKMHKLNYRDRLPKRDRAMVL